MMRAALVGVSGYGRWHLLMLMEQAALGRVRLTAATIINQTQEAGICARLVRPGVEIFSDYDAMLAAHAGRLDLVLLPTGIHHHAPMTLAALHAGAHVLVEKPLAPTLQEIDAIIAAETTTGRHVIVGFQDLFVPSVHAIQRRVLAGEIGRLQRVVVTGQWPRDAAYFQRNNWAGRLRVGESWVLDSPLNNGFAHFVMLGLFWASPVAGHAATVQALEAELYRTAAIESFDTACVRAETSGGATLECYVTHAGNTNRPPEVRLVGSAGEITWRYEDNLTLHRDGQPLETERVPDQLSTRLQVLDDALTFLEGQPRFVVRPTLARSHTQLIDALHEFFPTHSVAPDASGRLAGVDAAIATGAAHGVLFSELPFEWVRKNPRVVLRNYPKFAGVFGEIA
jgi:predicted dehydrogenase